ncbi:MAG: hypothetical protein J6A28_03400 [Clostridia bacterium]|nr:hypothetical protein [Clostridia bacterium]
MEEIKSFYELFEESCDAVSKYDQDDIVNFVSNNTENREEIIDFITKKLKAISHNSDFVCDSYLYDKDYVYPDELEKREGEMNESLFEILNFISGVAKSGHYNIDEFKNDLIFIAERYAKLKAEGAKFDDAIFERLRDISQYVESLDYDGILFLTSGDESVVSNGLKNATEEQLVRFYSYLKDSRKESHDSELAKDIDNQKISKQAKIKVLEKVISKLLSFTNEEKLVDAFDTVQGLGLVTTDVFIDAIKCGIFNEDSAIEFLIKNQFHGTLFRHNNYKRKDKSYGFLSEIDLSKLSAKTLFNISEEIDNYCWFKDSQEDLRLQLFTLVPFDDIQTKKAFLNSYCKEIKTYDKSFIGLWKDVAQNLIKGEQAVTDDIAKVKYKEMFEQWLSEGLLQHRYAWNNEDNKQAKIITPIIAKLPKDWKKSIMALKAQRYIAYAHHESDLWDNAARNACEKHTGYRFTCGCGYSKATSYPEKDSFYAGDGKWIRFLDEYEQEVAREKVMKYNKKYAKLSSDLSQKLGKILGEYEDDYLNLLTPEIYLNIVKEVMLYNRQKKILVEEYEKDLPLK